MIYPPGHALMSWNNRVLQNVDVTQNIIRKPCEYAKKLDNFARIESIQPRSHSSVTWHRSSTFVVF